MIYSVAALCIAIVSAAMLLCLYWLLRADHLADRVAAADLLTTCATAVVAIGQILLDTHVFIRVVMAMAVLGFFGTVVFAKYLIGGKPID
ncbi:MAG: Na(+)/H(+) antiporter subunit F [Candidatus Dadabacteria bacterium]|nr:MAG: Na(+)/H(+) antiporter subunit F [Candidatus Dadabacteria bacterium]